MTILPRNTSPKSPSIIEILDDDSVTLVTSVKNLLSALRRDRSQSLPEKPRKKNEEISVGVLRQLADYSDADLFEALTRWQHEFDS